MLRRVHFCAGVGAVQLTTAPHTPASLGWVISAGRPTIVGSCASLTVTVKLSLCVRFFFNDAASAEIYALSLHDALPIWPAVWAMLLPGQLSAGVGAVQLTTAPHTPASLSWVLLALTNPICRLLLAFTVTVKLSPFVRSAASVAVLVILVVPTRQPEPLAR